MDWSKFYENTALIANGGGLVIWGTAELRNCDIYENDAPGTFGGGLYVGGGAVAVLADCRLYENTAETGGGLYNNGVLTLRTSLLERNTGPDGAQLYLAGGSELIYVHRFHLATTWMGRSFARSKDARRTSAANHIWKLVNW